MADEKIVQNECADFYPVTDLNNLIEQLYNHMEYDCLYHPAENNLFLTKIPTITSTVNMTKKDIDILIHKVSEEYNGEFILLQQEYQKNRFNSSIFILPSQRMIDARYSIFHNRTFPKNLPSPKKEDYSIGVTYRPESFGVSFKNMQHSEWGDYSKLTEFIWNKNDSFISIISGFFPGQEEFSLRKEIKYIEGDVL